MYYNVYIFFYYSVFGLPTLPIMTFFFFNKKKEVFDDWIGSNSHVAGKEERRKMDIFFFDCCCAGQKCHILLFFSSYFSEIILDIKDTSCISVIQIDNWNWYFQFKQKGPKK